MQFYPLHAKSKVEVSVNQISGTYYLCCQVLFIQDLLHGSISLGFTLSPTDWGWELVDESLMVLVLTDWVPARKCRFEKAGLFLHNDVFHMCRR